MTEILLFPAKVQGNGAAEEVASRIREANGRTDLDVLIIGRGGGAIEDLWAFNEEIVVRTIFESRIPVISSVGHETDTTLADFVADRRAATPTAAELATPNTRLDILQYLTNSEIRLSTSVQRSVNQGQERFIRLQNSVIFRQPERLYDGYLQKLDQLTGTLTQNLQQHYQKNQQTQVLLTSRLTSLRLSQKIIESSRYLDREIASLKINFTNFFEQQKIRAEKAYDSLSLIDPEKIIKRGFAIVRTAEQKVVKSTQDVKTGDFLSLEVSDGQIDVEVKMVKAVTFEENLAALEDIVKRLENGDVPLEEAIAEFQKGMKLSKALQKTLKDAEATMVKVMADDGTEQVFDEQ
jgi:exodeoxyribonuclease VII large subunit